MPAHHEILFPDRETAEYRVSQPPTEPPGAGEVDGRTLYTAVSAGTELAVFLGCYEDEGLGWGRFPFVPGYAASMTVTAVGAGVDDLAPGDRVFCMGQHRTWQRFPRAEVLPLPAGLDPAVAPLARLMNVTWSTLTTTPARPPGLVVVTGLGPIGLLGALIFTRAGYRVLACDPLAERCRLAEELGVWRAVTELPLTDPELGGRADLVVECSAHEAAMLAGLAMLRKGGELVQVGVPMRRHTEIPAQELANRLFRRCVTMRSGSEWQVPLQGAELRTGSVFAQLAAALDWLADGSVPTTGLCAVVRPDRPQELYDQLRARARPELITILDWTPAGNEGE